MFELINDTFVFSEEIGENSAEAIVEGEIYISDDMPNIEKIISVNGKVKVNNIVPMLNKSVVYGELNFAILYQADNEFINSSSTFGKIDFMEEVDIQGASELMETCANINIDYIDTELISDRKIKIKAVINIDTKTFSKKDVKYISDISNTQNFQMKTKNIKYTNIINSDASSISLKDKIELDVNMDEIQKILKIDANAYITDTDIMSERMLVEGICRIGVLYIEDNNTASVNYTAKEFPFTHYIEIKNSSESMLRKIDIELTDIEYTIEKDDDLDKKIIDFEANFDISAKIYNDLEKNVVTDCYSTVSNIELISNKVTVESIDEIKSTVTNYEKTFDVLDGSVKDVYTIELTPKISEKRIFNDKLVLEGFLDTDLIYLNGNIDKVDGMKTNLPFNISINLTEEQQNKNIDVDIAVNKFGAYRKNMSTVLVNAEILSNVTFKSKKSLNVISEINDLGVIDHEDMPSLVFRVVQYGETLWDIAKNYNVSIEYLKKVNDINDEDSLEVGDKILIERQVL